MRRWLLLAAYLPALTFLGHWPLAIDIPGTSLYVGLPERTSSHEAGHESHCHASAGSSSDVPLAESATVAVLADSPLPSAGDPPLIGVPGAALTWLAQACVTPIPHPPERTFQSWQ